MSVYTSKHEGKSIDAGVDGGLKISNKAPTNGQALIWNNIQYEPRDITLLPIYASNILINHSNNPSLEDGQPLSNMVAAVNNKVDIETAGTQVLLTPSLTENSTITDSEISLKSLTDKLYTKQFKGKYEMVGSLFSNGTIIEDGRLFIIGSPVERISIFFTNLHGSALTSSTLLVGFNNGTLIPILTTSDADKYYGLVELIDTGYVWKIVKTMYNGSPSSSGNINYISTESTSYVYMTKHSEPPSTLQLKCNDGSIQFDSMVIYKYIY